MNNLTSLSAQQYIITWSDAVLLSMYLKLWKYPGLGCPISESQSISDILKAGYIKQTRWKLVDGRHLNSIWFCVLIILER